MAKNIYELGEITAAQYWEAQADMWHKNYAECFRTVEQLKAALEPFVQADIIKLTHDNEHFINTIRVTEEMLKAAREALDSDNE